MRTVARPKSDSWVHVYLQVRPRLARTVWACVFALQVMMPGLATVADASSAAGGPALGAPAHVESPSDDPCLTIHADDCALCLYRATLNDSPRQPSRRLAVPQTAEVALGTSQSPRDTKPIGHPIPRGPPSLF